MIHFHTANFLITKIRESGPDFVYYKLELDASGHGVSSRGYYKNIQDKNFQEFPGILDFFRDKDDF
jgi:hypothetical protein